MDQADTTSNALLAQNSSKKFSSDKNSLVKKPQSKNKGVSLLEKKQTEEKNAIENEDKFICFICANKTKYWAIGACNHPFCVLCSLRLKVLFKTNDCPYCKVDPGKLIYTDTNTKQYTQLQIKSDEYYDSNLNFVCQSKPIYEYAIYILSYNCPYKNCGYVDDQGWAGLKHHVQITHNMEFCEICISHKKVFPHEHSVFLQSALKKHYKRGNGRDFRGHPECGFCHISFYDNDMLFDHCRKKHEQCFICQQLHINKDVYYKNYSTLADHFENAHFACNHPTCIEAKFVVFGSAIDLKAHEIEVHGKNVIGQRAKWEAKKVPITIEHERYVRPGQAGSNRSKNNNARSNNSDTILNKKTNSSNQQPENSRPETQKQHSNTRTLPEANSSRNNILPTKEALNVDSKLINKPSGYGKLSIKTPDISTAINTKEQTAHTELLNFALKVFNNDNNQLERFRQLTTNLKSAQITPRAYYEELKNNLFVKDSDNIYVIKAVASLIKDSTITNPLIAIIRDTKNHQFPSLISEQQNSSNLNIYIQRQSKNPWNVGNTAEPKTKPKAQLKNQNVKHKTPSLVPSGSNHGFLSSSEPPLTLERSVSKSKQSNKAISAIRTDPFDSTGGAKSYAKIQNDKGNKPINPQQQSKKNNSSLQTISAKSNVGTQTSKSKQEYFPSLESAVSSSLGTNASSKYGTSVRNINNTSNDNKNTVMNSASKKPAKNIVLRIV
ncbi:hypothetical protein BB561_003179 [Smittium simulii]|uniref:RING-type E3 ubiquitin transferase n=1 Tax=Smittium simulii TaxID=133385 RepID=A0A2T9YMS4_9FUNG|nr:hypothetical protein BB561_003179 [Smittium simulii]